LINGREIYHIVPMKRVTGIGGVFFKSNSPDKLREWYRTHLGIQCEDDDGATFKWCDLDDPKKERYTVWSPFAADTDYFAPSEKPFMINFQVENLDDLLAQLKGEGVEVDPRVETYDYGKFGWIMDPEGNRIELWEPPANTK
jgi:predicted enzyme related to lactoylglutathione lyase